MLSNQFDPQIQNHIDQKTKPLGALGELENVAAQLAKIQSHSSGQFVNKIALSNPKVVVFAGDHGIAEQGVSIAPSAVTQQMVTNFLAGGAAINCFCRVNNIDFQVVDCGMLAATDTPSSQLILSRLGCGTEDFSTQPSMSPSQLAQGLEGGRTVVSQCVADGADLLIFGEMGIGNTSSASALLSALTDLSVAESVGLGTGINPEQLVRKTALVEQALSRFDERDVMTVLAQLGGFEIVHMVGAFLQASEQQVPVLVDGFIVSVAALAACKLEPAVREYLIFSHVSNEGAHRFVLDELNASPLLDLSMRLGEGTGAALALPLIRCAVEFYNEMVSFESAGVTV
ncbi:nicotinate-nucleotide--dimethylbenzimidazole phosphoribosyltransferase [Vibrio sp. CB1-14]|uniref:Nicotinate-nucleotide--dimethylbenzimidazole phosphoribosyltransferase n=1 Tax=Vibrio chaetopteri TaxID=3016528 RepID=A0AAU8BPG0_9VIBR